MATYVVRTTIQPDVEYTVDEGEYDRLVALGLLLDGPVAPSTPVFDQTVAELVDDPTSLTYLAVRATSGSGIAGTGVTAIRSLTQAAYNALATKDATTLYVIVG